MTLAKLLKQQNKPQVALGAYLGISPSMINLWCRHGYPIPEKHISKIAKFFNIEAKELSALARKPI